MKLISILVHAKKEGGRLEDKAARRTSQRIEKCTLGCVWQ